MDKSQKSAWGGSRMSRRQMLSYSLAGMDGVAGGLLPALTFGDTNKILGTKNGGGSQNMLKKGVIGTTLRGNAQKIAPIFICGKGFSVPLADGIWRIGDHNVKAHELIIFNKGWSCQSIVINNAKVFDTVQKQVHAGNRRGQGVDFLPIELYVAPLFSLRFKMGDGGNQHSRAAAGGVIYGFAGLRLEHLGHEVDNRAVCIKFLCRVAAVVGEFAYQILVALPKLVFRAVFYG